MYILGICNGYVATAILLKDGKVVSCASEERFVNIKSYNGFPKNSIDWCLKYAGVHGSDLDLVTTPYLQRPPFQSSSEQRRSSLLLSGLALLYTLVNKPRLAFRMLRYRFPILRPISFYLHRFSALLVGSLYTQKYKEYTAKYLGTNKERVVAFDHHLSHAAAAYYSSPFNQEQALVFTLDAEGDNFCSSVNIFEGGTFQVLAKTPRENSMGYLYGITTKFLGMKPHEHEYKVMGLAPYARKDDIDKVYAKLEQVITLDPKNPLKFKTITNAQDFEMFLRENLSNIRFDYLAGAIQKLLEERLKDWILAGVKEMGIKTVVVSGGVFMNVKANQKLAALPQVEKLFILPSCSDESAPIGSAYLGYLDLCKKTNTGLEIRPIKDIYWGPEYSDDEISTFLQKVDKYEVKKFDNIEEVIAKLLSEEKIVANLSGRMEFGARALGNRSILANPINPQVVRTINDQIKGRDFWMPFAPTILWERMGDYIINPKKIFSPYMMMAFDSTPKAQKELIAALHPYDHTLRPQILSQEMNPRYYKIIKEFEKLTGIGGVLNTSFNLHGFPIVRGPKEALFTFENSGLEYLVLNNFLISKNGQKI